MIELKNVRLRAGDFALDDVSFAAEGAEYFALLGPTGSGKTLLLKIIAGILRPCSGAVFFDGQNVTGRDPEERGFGYVAQNYRLFPHLDAAANALFSPKARGLAAPERDALLKRLSSMLSIESILKRGIAHLSGGEKQRVALARALASGPRAMLLDEPFSAIDEGLKKHLWFEIKNVLSAAGVPVIHVTHDIEEAVTLADKIAVVIDGKIRQTGAPAEILLRPSSEAVARYLGIKNLFAGSVVSADGDVCAVECSGQKIAAPAVYPSGQKPSPGESAVVCARPQSVKIIRPDEPVRAELKDNLFEGKITRAYFFSDSVSVFVKCGELEWESRFPHAVWHRNALNVGKKISVALWRPDIIIYRDTLLK